MAALNSSVCPWIRPHLEALETAIGANHLGHALLIAGRAGTGKLNLALLFADRLLTPGRGRPVPEFSPELFVEAMQEAREAADHHPDLHPVFPQEDKKTISVEQIRIVSEALNLKAHGGGAKVVVIEPAEAMTTGAANALLKTLEEPTADTYLILVSHRPGRLPATIRSRCHLSTVAGPKADELAAWLKVPNADDAALTPAGARLAPLAAAARKNSDYYIKYNEFYGFLKEVYEKKADPQSGAEQWAKADPESPLSWLTEHLQTAIRARLLAQGTNPVTDRRSTLSENHWHLLSVAQLFELLRQAEQLRDQLGTGVNVELAFRVLLNGFVPPSTSGGGGRKTAAT